ncbi:MAG: response regulator transcription factor [Eubacteriales bacterium]|nr:response regulator transcription factor [Eubacteriales bacterium]
MQHGYIYDCRIRLVDDNAQLRQMVKDILKKEGFLHVDTATNCGECRQKCREGAPDLIILDVGLPDGDGFSLMNEIRAQFNMPVLFLSARDEDCDRLLGLGLGADDYMTKPFLPRELVLRLSAILKRTYFPPGMAERQQEDVLKLGNRIVDFGEGCVRSSGTKDDGKTEQIWKLTAKEITILKKLNENRGRIVTFDALSQALWGDFYYGYENSLMVHIRRLREKIEENPSQPRFLTTARGLGYKLEK